MGTGVQRVAGFWDKMIKALTDPLTAQEKESGRYDPPPPPRVIYEGTILDAQKFFNQTTPIAACGDCPIAKYTDGLPIVVPTEQAVKEMLTGTKHSADEQIYRYSLNSTTKLVQKSSSAQRFVPMQWTATVEKVATIAVMAGCKPEYLPTVLAMSTRIRH